MSLAKVNKIDVTNTSAVVLAAGKGTRMRSSIPKVLHKLAGKPLLWRVISTLKALGITSIYVVYATWQPEVYQSLKHLAVNWVEQKSQLGTAHAVLQALPHIPANHRLLVAYGDVPMITVQTLSRLFASSSDIAWLTAMVDNPFGFGRIIRDENNQPLAIIEEKDLTEHQATIKEINSGICLLPCRYLKEWLTKVDNNNSQSEFYLTDIFAFAAEKSLATITLANENTKEIKGVNTYRQLIELERIYQFDQAMALADQGVMIKDPNRFDLRDGKLKCGRDVTIDVNVIIEGKVTIGNRSTIGANVYLRDVDIGDDVHIRSHSVIEEAIIKSQAMIGPFARIRPKTVIEEHAKIGNFVEVKNSQIGAKSKVSHLSYIGDATIGCGVNIGAGTITCNYDGQTKHQTVIADGASIGANNSLIAPIHIANGAMTGAGSVISCHVPENALALERSRQRIFYNWQNKLKKLER